MATKLEETIARSGSSIGWTHFTFNPWVGCWKCAPECLRCYVGRQRSLLQRGIQPYGAVTAQKTWMNPFAWQDAAGPTAPRSGTQAARIFTCSLSDFFLPQVDKVLLPGETMAKLARRITVGADTTWRDAAWRIIRATPNLVYLILTKRPEAILGRLPADWGDGYPNVWLGTSVGCKQTLNKIDALRDVPVHPEAVRFVSSEPLLEDISREINLDGIGWLIAGGESGPGPEQLFNPADDWKSELKFPAIGGPGGYEGGRRTMRIEWAYALMLRAKQAGIPFYFKQVTATKSGVGENALGFPMHEFPPALNGLIWAAK
jgi:protein gp37